MAVIAASKVLRDVTLGPFQVWVWVWIWVLVQLVWPGSEHKCNVWLWEAVRSPVRRSHFTTVVCPTGRVEWLCERGRQFGDPDGSDDECPPSGL